MGIPFRPMVFVALVVAASACSSDSDVAVQQRTGPEPTSPGTAVVGPGTTSTTTTMAPVTTEPAAPLLGLELEVVASDIDRPIFVTAPPGDGRLFIVSQGGSILIYDGELATEPFLDIRADVESGGLEQGLLGLAFHPRYADNGRFFVYFINARGQSELAEFSAISDTMAEPESAKTLLTVAQPASNHNGGMLAFGPDGYLYLALGDGGGADDQFGNGQRPDTLLGTILRLDIDSGDPYAIPPDNPFATSGNGAPEVWAYGLRNPWRFAFDFEGGTIVIGDVGQGAREEVNVVDASVAGLNYGWSSAEGDRCLVDDCSSFVDPALTYDHGQGCSVTGGFVYRGAAMPELGGHYFYSDWCGGWIRSFSWNGDATSDQKDWTSDLGTVGQVTSFGHDDAGELYVTTGAGLGLKLVPVR
ncbi:MAG: PQQ-dependent sugar dehydrogenase [Acidimicrobiia bacterium]|nr:PQQ-dependent sugar dehydrogenase [Acidimicrobiia bacterium]